MKKKFSVLGIIVFMMMIGLMLVGCGNPAGEDKDPPYSLGYEMEEIDGGLFNMGDNYGSHNVELSSFRMGKYEVTQHQYTEVMGSNPSSFDGDDLPVEMVSWYDAIVFCNTLSIKEDLEPAYRVQIAGEWITDPEEMGTHEYLIDPDPAWENVEMISGASGYRLPTEAEWEYAARGGQESEGYEYSGSDDPDEVAWYLDNSDNTTHEVGEKEANELGLYDMSGNVWEWCWDWYGSYPDDNLEDNYAGASSGTSRVGRGGSWSNDAYIILSSSFRHYIDPSGRSDFIGFRLVRPVV
jgi:formylglycine-generating enzyme required for sulfatase activity